MIIVPRELGLLRLSMMMQINDFLLIIVLNPISRLELRQLLGQNYKDAKKCEKSVGIITIGYLYQYN